MIEAWGKI